VLSVDGIKINNAVIGPKTRQLQKLYLNYIAA